MKNLKNFTVCISYPRGFKDEDIETLVGLFPPLETDKKEMFELLSLKRPKLAEKLAGLFK